MKPLNMLAIAMLVLIPSRPSAALAGRPVGSVFIRGAFEYSGASLGDLEDYQKYNNAMLEAYYGLPPTWKNVGAAAGRDLELGYQISPRLSVGIGTAYARHSRKNSSAGLVDVVDEFGAYVETVVLSMNQHLETSIAEITGNVTFWVPGAEGLFLGVQGGLGMGRCQETWTASVATESVPLFSSDFKGNGFVGGAFAGYDVTFSSRVSLFAKAGYRLRDLGKLKGHYIPREDGEPAQHEMIYEDLDGNLQRIGFDYSGMFAAAGVGFSFGGVAH